MVANKPTWCPARMCQQVKAPSTGGARKLGCRFMEGSSGGPNGPVDPSESWGCSILELLGLWTSNGPPDKKTHCVRANRDLIVCTGVRNSLVNYSPWRSVVDVGFICTYMEPIMHECASLCRWNWNEGRSMWPGGCRDSGFVVVVIRAPGLPGFDMDKNTRWSYLTMIWWGSTDQIALISNNYGNCSIINTKLLVCRSLIDIFLQYVVR